MDPSQWESNQGPWVCKQCSQARCVPDSAFAVRQVPSHALLVEETELVLADLGASLFDTHEQWLNNQADGLSITEPADS